MFVKFLITFVMIASNPPEDNVQGYVLEERVESSYAVVDTFPGTFYETPPMMPLQRIYARVRAYNAAGLSPYSEEVSGCWLNWGQGAESLRIDTLRTEDGRHFLYIELPDAAGHWGEIEWYYGAEVETATAECDFDYNNDYIINVSDFVVFAERYTTGEYSLSEFRGFVTVYGKLSRFYFARAQS